MPVDNVGKTKSEVDSRLGLLPEAAYRDFYENAPDMFVCVEAETARILDCNRATAEVTGYTKDEIIGRPVFEMYHPDCMEDMRRAFERFATTGEVRDAELQLRAKNGSRIDVSVNVSAVRDQAGNVIYSRSVWRDISRRKQAEREMVRLAKFPEQDPNPVLRVAADGTVLYANVASRPILELWRCQRDRHVPDDWRAFIGRVLAGSQRRDADVHWQGRTYTLTFTPVRDADFVNIYGLDVTARRKAEQVRLAAQQKLLDRHRDAADRAEEALAEAKQELIRRTRLAAIGQVSSSIAHDLRNPLGAIRNASYFLRRHVPEERQKLIEYTEIIEQEVAKADRIITSLLEMARPRPPRKSLVDLGALLDDVLSRTRGLAGVHRRVLLEPQPFEVLADPQQLHQVVENIVTNAAEAMKGQGEFTVEARRDDDYDTIVFRDTGPGVPPEVAENLFEPVVTTKASGTGLGLAICHQVIEKHQGTIDLVDTGAGGAAFRIRLPRQEQT